MISMLSPAVKISNQINHCLSPISQKMSAYGDLRAHSSGRVLATISWPTKRPDTYVTTIHLTITTARQSPGLVEYLNGVFAKVVEDGRTYPQEEDMSGEAFEKYFFAADVILGIVTSSHSEGGEATLEDIRASRSWEECVAGFYYVNTLIPLWIELTSEPCKHRLSQIILDAHLT